MALKVGDKVCVQSGSWEGREGSGMSDDDYQVDTERPCPFCGNPAIHWRHCNACEDGYINHYEEDPLWYGEDDEEWCPDCHGHGVQMWCPKCGKDPRVEKVLTVLGAGRRGKE